MTYHYLSPKLQATEYHFCAPPMNSRRVIKLDIPSPQLGNEHRDVLVYLPPQYFTEPTRRYPVFYMHDGHNIFSGDPEAPFGTWDVDITCENLISSGEIEPLIIVGIASIDRFPELLHCRIKGQKFAPKIGKYTEYLINTVKPIIDSNFRTIPDTRHTAIGGSSLGGLASFRIAWKHPYIFSKVAALSPSSWVGSKEDWETSLADESLEDLVNKTAWPKIPQLKIYLDNGTRYVAEGEESYEADAWCYTDRLRNALILKGYDTRQEYLQEGAEALYELPKNSNPDNIHELFWAPEIPHGYLSYDDYLQPDKNLCHLVGRWQGHNEPAWKARFAAALRFLWRG